MNTATLAAHSPQTATGPQLDNRPSRATIGLFVLLLVGGLIYTAYSLMSDVSASVGRDRSQRVN